MHASRSEPPRPAPDLWRLGVLPMMAFGALAGLIGVYWDIAWHVDKGRDTFFTPPHDFIYTAMLLALLTTAYGLWRDRRDTRDHLRIAGRSVHPGLLVHAAGAALVLFFAPADEIWHRLYGTDVTLWGPMHLVGLTGFTLAGIGGIVTAQLERGTAAPPRRRLFAALVTLFATTTLGWAVLLLAEYEMGVPQFRTLYHPALLAGLTAFPLVLVARLAPTAWPATVATLGFTALRLGVAGWLIGASRLDLAGFTRPAIPVLVATGLVVDALVWFWARRGGRAAPGWLAGLIAGLATIAVNVPVMNASHVLPWTSAALVPGAILGAILAAAAGHLAASAARALKSDADRAERSNNRVERREARA